MRLIINILNTMSMFVQLPFILIIHGTRCVPELIDEYIYSLKHTEETVLYKFFKRK